ncbi:hypothetical protein M1446_01665 [Candidatus Dependentiae bacterium]|nr:hypothetical protein [Candidatus Dependentiae bacterium]
MISAKSVIAILFLLLIFCNSTYCIEIFSVPVVTYGKVKFDSIFDTRQIPHLISTQDVVLLYPSPKLLDNRNKDINAHGRYNMAAIESRIGFKVEDFCINDDTKLLAIVEMDFVGAQGFIAVGALLSLINPFPNTLRMRYCYFKLDWEDESSLLVGHYSHLLCPEECQPETISINTGAPIELECRESQVRYAKRFGDVEFSFALHEQVDFVSTGPGEASPQYLRNAILPDIAAKLTYNWNESSLGAILDFKRLIPRTVTFANGNLFNHKESINGIIGEVYLDFKNETSELKVKLIYEDNASEFASLGSYAVKTIDPVTDFRTYANIPAIAFWVEYIYDLSECFQFGIFTGATKKLGANQSLAIDSFTGEPIIFGLNPSLEYVYRVSPRIKYRNGPCEVGLEFEVTGAGSGKNNEFGTIPNPSLVNNFRVLTAVTYYF